MSSESQQALIRRSTDTELMPPPPTKRIKRPPKVLDEDAYTDALSKIIARDFFPGLLETRTQQEYLDALDSQDREWIASAGRKLTEVMTPGGPGRRRRGTSLATPRLSETPRGYNGDTPMSFVSSVSAATTQTPEVELNMSLDSFQAKYTSEDNESFNKLLDKQNQKRAAKYRWLWAGNKIPAARQIKHREREQKLLQAKTEQEKTDGGKQMRFIEGPDQRKAMPDTWDAKPNNQIFFTPDGVEDELETLQQSAEATSRAPPKAVSYGNTRFPPPPPEVDATIPPSPSISAIQDAIAGRPRVTDSEPGFSGARTPRVNGYAFVDDEPTPAESSGAALLLGSGDATPNPFKIKEQSRRESLHHRMVDRVAKNNRPATRKGVVGGTPTPKFGSSPNLGGNLTPAARQLWSKVASPRTTSGSSFGARTGTVINQKKKDSSSLRYRWTPTPEANKAGKE